MKTRHSFEEKALVHLWGSMKWVSKCKKCPVRRYHYESGAHAYINEETHSMQALSMMPGCIGSTAPEKPDIIPLTGTKYQKPNRSLIESSELIASPETPFIKPPALTQAEAFLKELMVTLKVFYESVASCALDAKTLQMVENKLLSSEYREWMLEFSRRAEIWDKFKARENNLRDYLIRQQNKEEDAENPA